MDSGAGDRLAKPSRAEYAWNLPHYQHQGRTYFVTFSTSHRWVLPECVRDTVLTHCLHDNGVKAAFHAAVVMPDHVHLLLTPGLDAAGQPYSLAEIIGAIKGASAHSVNRLLGRTGHVWQDESFDHLLRNEESVAAKVAYIIANPTRRHLAPAEGEYRWLWREAPGK